MQRTFVLDKNKQPIMPCHPARARMLLKQGKAAIYRLYPFTIILKERESGNVQPIEVKIDPGSRTTGVAAVLKEKKESVLIWGAHLHHRGLSIKESLLTRRSLRAGRRARKTRYRCARFDNRKKPAGWLTPSIKSRVDDVSHLVTKHPLHDAAAVNTTRLAIVKALSKPEFDVLTWSGGLTKFNRTLQNYPKDHYIDAACVGKSGASVKIHPQFSCLEITAMGRGSRQQCKMDRYGFPRTKPKKNKCVLGFQTGDLVSAKVLTGKKIGIYKGRVAVRSSGNFNIKTPDGTVEGINAKYCKRLHRMDGYMYHNKPQPKGSEVSSPT
jgi:hypothetical protein